MKGILLFIGIIASFFACGVFTERFRVVGIVSCAILLIYAGLIVWANHDRA